MAPRLLAWLHSLAAETKDVKRRRKVASVTSVTQRRIVLRHTVILIHSSWNKDEVLLTVKSPDAAM